MRRRKARVVWLPLDINNRLGSAPAAATNTITDSSHFIISLSGPPLGDPPLTQEIPLVMDAGGSSVGGQVQGVVLPERTLADIEDSGYRLRRIVGKLFFGIGQDTTRINGDTATQVITAGVIVRRVQPGGNSLAAAAGTANGELLSTATLDNIVDPWIWRRSWILSNLADPVNTDGTIFPLTSNVLCGSALDGPHIDQKTARVIGPEERLFLSITCQGIDGNSQTEPLLVICVGDLRILGSMRTTVGNRRNASR